MSELFPAKKLTIDFQAIDGQSFEVAFGTFYRGPKGDPGDSGGEITTVANFAAIPGSPSGWYLVLADETKNGGPHIYLFTGGHRYWFAMVQDA